MRFKLDTYEVEIKAKEFGKERMNKKDTLALVGYLICTFMEAETYNKEHGYHALADRCRRDIRRMHKAKEMMKQGY